MSDIRWSRAIRHFGDNKQTYISLLVLSLSFVIFLLLQQFVVTEGFLL